MKVLPSNRHRRVAGPSLVPGTLVVAGLIATGRWGSHLRDPSGSLYLTDIGLILSVAWTVFHYWRSFRATARELLWLVPVATLLLVACIRFVAGDEYDMTALRDFMPYAYASVAGLALLQTGSQAWRRTAHAFGGALVLHAVWVTVALLDRSLPQQLPLIDGRLHVFDLRPDFDGAMLAVLLGMALQLLATRRSLPTRLALLAVALWSSYLILQLANRAAVLALVVALLLVLVANARNILRANVRYTVMAVVLLAVLAALVVPRTDIYARISNDPRFAQNAASGTQDARLQVWDLVLTYIATSPDRVVVGVGFGPDFIRASGANYILEGTNYTDVRAPHNYPINTYARMGLIGAVALAALLLTALIAIAMATRGRAATMTRLLPAALICGTIFIISLIGVNLESPFGAIPFFWALGHLLLRRSAVVADVDKISLRLEPATQDGLTA